MTAFPKTSKNLSRRGFIGASALAPAALMLQAGEAHAAANTRAQLAAVHSGSPAHQLLYKTDEFFIAHRGAGNISPEHTAYAYAESVRRGALAVEISVRTTSDGQFVCMHDTNIKRTTGASMDVRGHTLAELRQHKVDMRQNLGEKTGLYDIPTLEEAIAAVDAVPAGGEYASVGGKKVVLFLEAKDGPAQAGLVKFITERGLQRRTVIKMYRDGSGGFKPTSRYLKLANSAGCATWCYFDGGDPIDKISAMARHENVDAIGVPYYEKPTGVSQGSMSEENVRALTGLGKAVIVWEIHRRSAYEKYKALGVKGFMCPDPYWVIGDPFDSSVKIKTGKRPHGMLPADPSVAADMPDLTGTAIVHNQRYDESVLLGPLANYTTREKYTLDFSMKWTGALPKQDGHYGYIAFGREHDGAFGIGKKFSANQEDGTYVLAIRPNYPRRLRSADPLLRTEPGKPACAAHHEAAPEGHHRPGTELQDRAEQEQLLLHGQRPVLQPHQPQRLPRPVRTLRPFPRHQRWRSSGADPNRSTSVLDLREPVGLVHLGARLTAR